MNTLDTYTCTDSWGLVYDAASSGDFIGTIQEITGYRSLCYIGSGIPGNDNAGFVLSGGFLQISVNAANKLYAKRYPGDPYSMPKLSLAMANITVVGGAVAVGSAPTANPVGVSGVDGEGKKRALLTDATGKLTTVTPDCLDVSGSVSSADVLFTVDMLNYQSITVHLISAGSGCTITWECSANQIDWLATAGVTISPSFSTNSFSTNTGAISAVTLARKLRYFRARVSVYGSGTVTVAGNLLSGHALTSLLTTAIGTANEAAAVSGIPITIAAEARSTRKTAVANGQVVRPIATVDGRLIMRPHSIPENEWSYAAPAGGIVNSSSPVTLAAAVSTLSIYVTSIQLRAQALTNATEIALRDGAGTVYWRSEIGTSGMPLTPIKFDDPIKIPTNSSLTFITLTASGTGAVYINAQGYIAP